MINELIFIAYILIVSSASLGACKIGKEALVAIIAVFWVLTNLFVTKQILLFGWNATASDALAVGATLSLNLLQEYWGKKIAQKTIIIGFFAALIYSVLSYLQILYCPSPMDTAHEHFCALLTPMPRIALASLFTYLLVQQIDFRIFGLLKNHRSNLPLYIRNYISAGFTQFIDTVLFSFLGLYGIIDNIGEIIFVSYSIKLGIILFSAPLLSLSKYFLKDTHV